mmetsp:Transcript_15825/g.25321  ORF Transcript_15825/g.25321 Transcript_15825/m.25321 type:complete len:102 (+) Transcript_15825:581-886(+)
MGGVYEKSALRDTLERDYVTFAHETASSRTQWRDMNYNRWHTETKLNSEAYGLADDGFYYPTDDYIAFSNPVADSEKEGDKAGDTLATKADAEKKNKNLSV